MLVKFHFGKGDTLTIVARDDKGHETDNKRDAIRTFQRMLPDVVFMTDDEYQRRRHADREKAIAEAIEAEAQKHALAA